MFTTWKTEGQHDPYFSPNIQPSRAPPQKLLHTDTIHFKNTSKRSAICSKRGGEKIKLHNEDDHNAYSSPHLIRVIKLRARWTDHVARVEETRNNTTSYN
jgi:hypothetical protein